MKENFIQEEIKMTEKEKIDNLSLPIYELGLSVRSGRALLCAGYRTLEDIVKAKESDIKNLRNVGRRSFNEIRTRVAAFGYPTFGVDTDGYRKLVNNGLNEKPFADITIIEASLQVKNVPSLDGYDYFKIINIIRDWKEEHNFGKYEIRPGWTLTYHPEIEVLYIKFRLGYAEPKDVKED